MSEYKATMVTGSMLMLTEELNRLAENGWEFVAIEQMDRMPLSWTVISRRDRRRWRGIKDEQ